jgi:hypothetical protein
MPVTEPKEVIIFHDDNGKEPLSDWLDSLREDIKQAKIYWGIYNERKKQN